MKPALIAHRGWSGDFPENSLAAFAAAVAVGCDEIELDVRLSRDRVPVVIHDADLERTTTASGPCGSYDMADLATVDVRGPAGRVHTGMGIPGLASVLELFGPGTTMNIHVKEAGGEAEIIRLLRAHLPLLLRAGSYVAAAPDVLKVFADGLPELARCCLKAGLPPDEQIRRAVSLGCARVQFARRDLSPELVARAHAEGLLCNLFHADDEAALTEALACGVDAILSNEAGFARRFLAARPGGSPG